MKTSKTSRSLSACLLALVAWPVLSFSQDVKKDTPAAPDAPPPQIIEALNIKNVTYGELVDILRKETGENIVLSPRCRTKWRRISCCAM